jgi:uncharacterized protein (TIGR04255 family)
LDGGCIDIHSTATVSKDGSRADVACHLQASTDTLPLAMLVPAPLPRFAAPPVEEVALTVVFDPLTRLRSVHLGLLWERLRSRYPAFNDQLPLPAFRSGAAYLDVQVADEPTLPRVWFLNESSSQLVQFQRDRISVNWRRRSLGDEYPHYSAIRQELAFVWALLGDFVAEQDVGPLAVSGWNVSYVNPLRQGAGWERVGQVGDIVALWNSEGSDDFLSEPAEVAIRAKYRLPTGLGDAGGLLSFQLDPAMSLDEGTVVLLLQVTAEGPVDSGKGEEVLDYLDVGHEWIVRGFTSFTRSSMHAIWKRRRDDDPDC